MLKDCVTGSKQLLAANKAHSGLETFTRTTRNCCMNGSQQSSNPPLQHVNYTITSAPIIK